MQVSLIILCWGLPKTLLVVQFGRVIDMGPGSGTLVVL